MFGGSALTRNFAPSDSIAAASCDEDSAFAFVETVAWMRPWCAGLPVLACDVAHLLSPELLDQISDIYTCFVAPQYKRLAMGSSHSVYLLMQINLQAVGCTLFNYSRLLKCQLDLQRSSESECTPSEPLPSLDFKIDDSHMHELDQVSDEEWLHIQKHNKSMSCGESGFTVIGWCRAVREAKQRNFRVITCMVFFAGPRRELDVEDWLDRKSVV